MAFRSKLASMPGNPTMTVDIPLEMGALSRDIATRQRIVYVFCSDSSLGGAFAVLDYDPSS